MRSTHHMSHVITLITTAQTEITTYNMNVRAIMLKYKLLNTFTTTVIGPHSFSSIFNIILRLS